MPAIRRGKKKGIKQFSKRKSSYKTTYTMSRGQDDDVTFDLWIVCKYRKGKRKKRGVEYIAYVAYNVKVSLTYVHMEGIILRYLDQLQLGYLIQLQFLNQEFILNLIHEFQIIRQHIFILYKCLLLEILYRRLVNLGTF
jgi:hypothetical protein